jgi:hypothetical protein
VLRQAQHDRVVASKKPLVVFGEGLAAFVRLVGLRSSASPARKEDDKDEGDADEENGRGQHVGPTIPWPGPPVKEQ